MFLPPHHSVILPSSLIRFVTAQSLSVSFFAFCLFFSLVIFHILYFPHPLSAPLPPPTPLQATKERQSTQAQLKALSQQSEAAHRELTEVLGRRAQREEELHRKDVELSESRQRHLSLEQEVREVWGSKR